MTPRALMPAPHRSRALACFAAALACLAGAAWAQGEALKHDPFARPALSKAEPPPAAQQRDNDRAGKGAPPAPPWRPELDAIVNAGPKSMVSIGGAIVGIGEEINGHRLVEVHEQTAVFVKNRKRVTLSLRGVQLPPEAAAARRDERDAATPRRLIRPDTPLKQDAPPKPDDRGAAERRDERKAEK